MSSFKSKNAKKIIEYDIDSYTKGFISTTIIDVNTVQEYFPFAQITQIIHHPNVGVEIVRSNNLRKVYYNDVVGESQIIFDDLNSKMVAWMSTN